MDVILLFLYFSSVFALLHYFFLCCLNLKGSGVATPPPLLDPPIPTAENNTERQALSGFVRE